MTEPTSPDSARWKLAAARGILISEEDEGLIRSRAAYVGVNGYAYCSQWVDGRSSPTTLHSLIMGHHPGCHIDHINGNKLDNRRSNLRVVTPQVNQVNRKNLNRNNSSGVRGVTARGERWIAQICVKGQGIYLGTFTSKAVAIAARQTAELAYFGELCP